MHRFKVLNAIVVSITFLLSHQFKRSNQVPNGNDDLQIELLSGSHCVLKTADGNISDVRSDGAVNIHANQTHTCSLQIRPTSAAQILISLLHVNITVSTDFLYVERIDQLDVCSNRYVAFMEMQQPCQVNFGKYPLVLRIHGDVTIRLQAALNGKDQTRNLRCPEDANNKHVIDTLEGQPLSCKELKGINFMIPCDETSKMWCAINKPWEKELKTTTRCDIKCSKNCICVLSDREVIFQCPQSTQEFDKTNGLLFFSNVVAHLDLSYNSITTLMNDTFRYCGPQIKYLDLSSNLLEVLPPVCFHHYVYSIIYLDLSCNLIRTVHTAQFNDLYNLAFIDMSDNKLERLDVRLFDQLLNLISLNLSYNILVTLDVGLFDNLTNLNNLFIHSNRLVTLDVGLFDNLTNLDYISLYSNRLVTLDVGLFDNLTNLSYLLLPSNRLVTLGVGLFDKLTNLDYISLYSNRLATLDVGLFDNLTNLNYLYLHSNRLVTLDVGLFDKLTNLTYLSLSSNRLVTLDVHLFDKLNNLLLLDLSDCPLVSIESQTFRGLHKLTKLYMTNTSLASLHQCIFHGINELNALVLANNTGFRYYKLGTFSGLINLEILILSFNSLTFLEFHLFDDLHSLRVLDLSGNRLQSIPQLGHMQSLSIVDLSDNPLTKLTSSMTFDIQNKTSVFVNQPEVCKCYFNNSDNCFNSFKPSPYLTCDRLLSITSLTVFTWIIGLSAIFGNLFVVCWKQFKLKKDHNKVQTLLLNNLAVSDLQMGIYMIIIASADIYYGEYFPMSAEHWRSSVVCRIAGSLAITSSEASVLFVTLISIDRFITIKFPFHFCKLRLKSTILIAIIVWVFSLTIGLTASILAGESSAFYDSSHVCIGLPLAQIIHPQTQTKEKEFYSSWYDVTKTYEVVTHSEKHPGLYFAVSVFIGFNLFCFLLILSCYIGLMRAVSKTSREALRQKQMAEEIRMTIKVSAIVLTDFFCWFPICFMGTFVQIGLTELPNSVFAWVVAFVLPINSAINPFLYTIMTVISDRCSRKSGCRRVKTKSKNNCTRDPARNSHQKKTDKETVL